MHVSAESTGAVKTIDIVNKSRKFMNLRRDVERRDAIRRERRRKRGAARFWPCAAGSCCNGATTRKGHRHSRPTVKRGPAANPTHDPPAHAHPHRSHVLPAAHHRIAPRRESPEQKRRCVAPGHTKWGSRGYA